MKAKLKELSTIIFKKGNFGKFIIILSMILVTICICVAIVGYYKIVDVNVNIKKQANSQER